MTALKKQSSNIQNLIYNDETETLKVTFTSGTTYEYFDVPEDVYEEFTNAESLGKFFHEFIKGKYLYAKEFDNENDIKK